MAQQPEANIDGQVALLQAEGILNKQIQSALLTFRQKIGEASIAPNDKHSPVHNYNTFKQGPEKVFQFRESLLSLMFKIKDFKTLYNMVIASFIILTFTLILSNYQQHGQILDHEQLQSMFAGFTRVGIIWVLLASIHFTIIPIVKIGLKTSKRVYIPLYIAHLIILMGTAMWFSQDDSFGFVCIIMMMAEATRMVMKSHSYFRTKMLYLTQNDYKNFNIKDYTASNQTKRDSQENQEEKEKHIFIDIKNNDIFTQFKNLAYFFVAPTIIYRDNYTLTPIRKMSRIITNALNFMACIYYAFILYVFLCREIIHGLENKLDFSTFMYTVIKLMLPSTFFLILGFFGFLHSWLNCWAEITRFPDKCFYSDWWNSIEFGSYYRKWNIIVHDWLYYFIYLDTERFLSKKKMPRWLPKIMTFMISAVIHELIITYALGFFYPILFILFTGPGILLIQNQKRLKSISVNLAFWLQMYIGSSLLFTFYLVESFARKRITEQFIFNEWGSVGYFIPRTIYLGNQA